MNISGIELLGLQYLVVLIVRKYIYKEDEILICLVPIFGGLFLIAATIIAIGYYILRWARNTD